MKSKLVQVAKDVINIRADGEPSKAEVDEEPLHGFIEKRAVFGTVNIEQFQNHHWKRIQKYTYETKLCFQ